MTVWLGSIALLQFPSWHDERDRLTLHAPLALRRPHECCLVLAWSDLGASAPPVTDPAVSGIGAPLWQQFWCLPKRMIFDDECHWWVSWNLIRPQNPNKKLPGFHFESFLVR
jgi:hypothetical protein